MLRGVRLAAARALAALWTLTWLLLPGFGLIDLSVSWDEDWAVVLEASWGITMTVLVGGSFLAVAVRPRGARAAWATLGVTGAGWLVAVAAGLEWPLLGFVALLAVQAALLLALLPTRPRWQPLTWSVSPALLALATLGAVPWLVHAADMWRANRRGAGVALGEVTNGIDHHAVQGALALSLVVLPLLAACWPEGRRFLGTSAGVCAGYVGLVSAAFPGEWAGFSPVWSWLCLGWAAALIMLSAPPRRSELRELGLEVVEPQRPL
ncbi:hypothetical protein SAMN05660748_1967 [Blastococcus aggregatus]|uniref:Uncharacterized protein n=1 Tax=Blastococcus aggregatus TaxID=38502 RepID=A0A285V6M5_9ACTN|nr:hypothetical protein SAMN05660748_1967 [Blastococcus aggregatus]